MKLGDLLKQSGSNEERAPVLGARSEVERAAAEIKSAMDAMRPKPVPQPRELGCAELGEQIPMDHPGPLASAADEAWFAALHSFQTQLVIILEPSPSAHGWLAVTAQGRTPILLHRFPLGNMPRQNQPF